MKTFLNKQSKPIVITIWAICLIIILSGKPWQLVAQAPQPAAGVKYAQVATDDLKEWLTYLSSDELQGRQVFTEGYGLAAQYIADHLKQWGVKPLNADGSYFQPVKLKGYRVTRNSSATVDSNGEQTTFKHGDHVNFSVNSGGKQTVSFNGVEFVGYGQQSDYAGRDVKGKLVLVVPNLSPNAAGAGNRGGARGGGGGFAASGAAAMITFAPASTQGPAEQALAQAQAALAQANAAVTQAQQALRGGGGRGFGGGGRGGAATPADLTTVQRVDGIVTPQ